MNMFTDLWNQYVQKKAESETFNQIWKDHYEKIQEIEKQESWMYGFLVGVVFTALFLLTLNYILIYLC